MTSFNIIKYTGGKSSELPAILDSTPESFKNYYEPFVGGGSVLLGIPHLEGRLFYVNDIQTDLINLYKMAKESNTRFFSTIKEISDFWNELGELAKLKFVNFNELYTHHKPIGDYRLLLESTIQFPNFIGDSVLEDFTKIVYSKLERYQKFIDPTLSTLSVESALKNALFTLIRYKFNSLKSKKDSTPEKTAFFYFIRNYAFSGMIRQNSKGDSNESFGGNSYVKKDI